MSTESLDPLVFLHVPNADPLVLAPASKVLAVGTDSQSPDLVGMSMGVDRFPRLALSLVDAAFVENVRLSAGVHVPLDDRALFARRVQPTTITGSDCSGYGKLVTTLGAEGGSLCKVILMHS